MRQKRTYVASRAAWAALDAFAARQGAAKRYHRWAPVHRDTMFKRHGFDKALRMLIEYACPVTDLPWKREWT